MMIETRDGASEALAIPLNFLSFAKVIAAERLAKIANFHKSSGGSNRSSIQMVLISLLNVITKSMYGEVHETVALPSQP
jgi:hypothetical protein